MKILLINPEIDNFYKSVSTPLGLLSIATHLKNNGHEVRVIDMAIRRYDVKKIIADFSPRVVGISVSSTKCLKDSMKISADIRSSGVTVVWGGHMASSVPELALQSGLVDYISIGEGEFTWQELLEALERNAGAEELKTIQGLAFQQNGCYIRTEDRPLADLRDLPVIDYTFLDVRDYFQSLFGCSRMLAVYTLKGCPGRCAFCFNQSFQKCSFRRRPVEHVMEEIRYLVEQAGADGIHYGSEMIARNSKELHEFCDKIDEMGLNFVWGGNARVGMIDPEDFQYMYDKGCRWLYFGLESGSKRVQELMNKRLPLEKVQPTIKACTDAGIAAITAYIVGFADETEDDLKQTIALKNSIPYALCDCNMFYMFPGTDVCTKMTNEGRYTPPTTLNEFIDVVPFERVETNYSKIPERDLRVARAYILWSSFVHKTAEKTGKTHFFAGKAITDAVKRVVGFGPKKSALYLWETGCSFLEIVTNLVFFPKIRKKYGMYRNQ